MHDWECIVAFNFGHNFRANKTTNGEFLKMAIDSTLYVDCYKLENGALYKKTKWITHMNGLLWGGQTKKKKKRFVFLQRNGQGETPN
jgi:hypothetical protein